MHRIMIYTRPTCSDSLRLRGWLNAMALRFVEHDLTLPAISDEAQRRTGSRVGPITVIEGEVILGTAADQIRQIRPLVGLIKAA